MGELVFRKGAGPLSIFPPIRWLARRSLRPTVRRICGYSERYRYGEVNSPSLNKIISLTLFSTAWLFKAVVSLRRTKWVN
jgi:hypothetical protein